ncbi:hypothetical protein [Streptomyces sp. NPDC004376]
MQNPIPVAQWQQPAAADVGSLVQLGREDPPPIPEPATDPFQEPAYPDSDWTDTTD